LAAPGADGKVVAAWRAAASAPIPSDSTAAPGIDAWASVGAARHSKGWTLRW